MRSIVLSMVMILGLAACGNVATGSGADDAGVVAESPSESSILRVARPRSRAGRRCPRS